jgi:FixJ family two-component response regulator
LVVIVDDDPAVRGALAFSLQTEGFSVQSFATGADLLNEPKAREARCFIIDYKLPGMNGVDLLIELRRRQVAAPAILITTNPSAAVRERAATANMLLIEKPLLSDALFQELRRLTASAS